MISDDLIARHYDQGDVAARIEAGLAATGTGLDEVTIDDLAPADEFHTGGRRATEAVLASLAPSGDMRVLDVGCGLGGAARYCAATYGCTVMGVDLTQSFIDAARTLTGWVGLDDRVTFECTSAENLSARRNTFDAAYLLHVAMNVADKTGLFANLAELLDDGGRLAVYDLMRADAGDLAFPLPWASGPATSFVSTEASYTDSLTAAGFEVVSTRNHHEIATAFVRAVQASSSAGDGQGPPPLGLHLVMGPDTGAKVANLIAALDSGLVTPVELIAAKPA